MFSFTTLDPRSIPAATEANDKVFDSGSVYGVEVTVPALAARCITNLDPQHGQGGSADLAAIEAALTAEIPSEGATLATVKADPDAVGAMAVLATRADGVALDAASGRVEMIAAADKAARGGWPGVQPLPTKENPWPVTGIAPEYAAVAAACADFKKPLGDRVSLMRTWLLTGEEPAGYRDNVERERADLVRALEASEIRVSTAADGRIAVVESSHRAATAVGYSHAPVIVARNPTFRVGGGDPHVKFTIAAYEPGLVDIKSALAELSALEAGWGGSPTIGGSPQGVSSQMTADEVVAVVTRHIVGVRVVCEVVETVDNDVFYTSPAREVAGIVLVTRDHAAAEAAVKKINDEAREWNSRAANGARKGVIRWYFGTI